MEKDKLDRIVMAAVIVVPLVIVGLFVVAISINKYFEENTEYDFLFTVKDYRQTVGEELSFDVLEGRLFARYKKSDRSSIPKTRLYIYLAQTDEFKEIAIDRQAKASDSEGIWCSFELEELRHHKLKLINESFSINCSSL